jgi:phosphoglycolate phosphatase
MHKSVIFDFDGTLADSREIVLMVYRRLANKYDLPELSPEKLEELKNLPIKDRFKMMRYPLYKVPEVFQEMKQTYRQHLSSLMPFPGMRDVLFYSDPEGLSLYILSSNSIENIRYFLHQHDMEFLCRHYHVPGPIWQTPHPGRLLRRHQILRQEAIYVGDELRDIHACRTAGIQVLAVTWGYDSASLLASGKPDYLASSPAEIMEILPGPSYPIICAF